MHKHIHFNYKWEWDDVNAIYPTIYSKKKSMFYFMYIGFPLNFCFIVLQKYTKIKYYHHTTQW